MTSSGACDKLAENASQSVTTFDARAVSGASILNSGRFPCSLA